MGTFREFRAEGSSCYRLWRPTDSSGAPSHIHRYGETGRACRRTEILSWGNITRRGIVLYLFRPDQKQVAKYAKTHVSWYVFRFWNRVGITIMLAFLPAIFSVGFFSQGTVFFPILPVVLLSLLFFLLAFAVYKIRTFACPKCKKPFTVRRFLGPNTTGRNCVHCGLPLYADA